MVSLRRHVLRAGRALFESRLFQFAVLGGLLFAVAPRPSSPRDIAIRSERLAALHAAEASRPRSRTLPAAKTGDVDQRALEDEILYREGVRLGLDKNDGIVRQRIVQKVLFLAEEVAGASRPIGEAELRAFFEKNQDRWAIPEHVHFTQIYQHRREALAAWAAGPRTGEPPPGEPSPVSAEIDADLSQIAAMLGSGFAEALADVKAGPGPWIGPVPSAFGFHLVRVLERPPARPARLDEVSLGVVEACSLARRQEATAAFLEGAWARYRVTLDGAPILRFSASRRVAFRAASSEED